MPSSRVHDRVREPPERHDEALHRAIDRLTFEAGRRAGAPEHPGPPREVRRIVTALDGTPASAHAVAWTKELARLHGAKVSLITVHVPPYVSDAMGAPAWWPSIQEEYARDQAEARRRVEEAFDELREAGVEGESVVLTGSPVHEIVRLCRDRDADLVILGSHSRGPLGRILLGSVADGVKNHVQASVLIARTDPRPPRLLIATDGSPASKRAASWGARLAASCGAHATVLHVVEAPDRAHLVPERRVLRETVEELGLEAEHVHISYALDVGRAADAIVQAALSRECGLVVMGSRGLGPLASLMAGSVSNRVAHEAPVSVLLVKEAHP